MWGGARIRSRLSPGQHETALYPAKCSAPTAHNERSITQPLTSECAPLGTPAHLGRSSAVSARFGVPGGGPGLTEAERRPLSVVKWGQLGSSKGATSDRHSHSSA